MGLLREAYKTYESFSYLAGEVREGEKESLAPIAHIITNANIEILLSSDGEFLGASLVDKNDSKTIIPATINSANRSSAPSPHPLSDQLSYLTSFNSERYKLYCNK